MALVAGTQAGIYGYGHGPSAVIQGPSGAVVRAGVAGGAYIAGPGFGAYGYLGPYGAYGYLGHGYEGQWIPEYSEKFYDDGSYKPWLYGH